MIVVDSKVWLAAGLALMPLLLAMDCGRFNWTFPAYPPSPLWSADQSKIVFNSGFGTLHGRMHVVDSDGSDLLSFPHKSGEYATGISSNGVIVFTELDTSDDGLFGLATPGYQVHTALLDGSDRRILAKGGQDYHYASWSPSGETIAFSSSMDKLHIMRQDGSAKKKLVDNNILRQHFPTADLVHVSPVFWSPDGGPRISRFRAPPRARRFVAAGTTSFGLLVTARTRYASGWQSTRILRCRLQAKWSGD